MPKVVSRNVVSESKTDDDSKDPSKALSIHYCLCGEFLLVLEGPLAALPRRPTDQSYALRNSGDKKKVYKLNAVGAPGREAVGVVVRRGKEFEYQRRLHCPRCQLIVGYETKPGDGQKGDATFLLPGGLTEQQSKVPSDAFGEPEGEAEK
ncbi:hypothetical protein MNV49_001675 [Pseudohyphozyma bogoriensis]|nr:hypothetical protein MNV49_001675 [Pseudohyphozyma bogoriensis]